MAGVRLTSAVIEIHSLDSGSAFVDVSADIRHDTDIEWEYGIRSSDITARAATSGIARFKLDNSVNNASAIRGWYSPDSGSTREGFIVGAKTRITLNYAGSPFYKYVGFVDQISPAPGIRKSQDVSVTAADYMDALARFRINAAVPAQTDITADIAASKILNVIEQQPEAISFSTGQDTLTFALDTGAANKTTALREMQKLAISEVGRLYQRGDASTGGVLVFEDRHFRILKTSSEASLNNTMVDMIIGRNRRRVKNRIRTRTHPRIKSTSASDLFTLDSTPEIRGGNSIIITGEYTDPTNANRKIGGASMIVPTASLDYTMNTNSDGSGTDKTFDQKGRIMAVPTSPSNLIGYWPLGDDAGTTSVKEETDIFKDRYGVASAVTFGASGIGDGRTSASFDGVSYINVHSSDLQSDFASNVGTIGAWAKVSASSIWTDSKFQTIFRLGVDADQNVLAIDISDTACTLRAFYGGGGTFAIATDTSLGATEDLFHTGMTWDNAASKVIQYINGASVASALLSGVWSGDLTASLTHIGAGQSPASQNNWSGTIAHPFITNEVLSSADFLSIFNAGSGGFNVDAAIGGYAVEYSIKNTEPTPAFVTFLQIRGIRIKDFQPILQEASDATSITEHGELELIYDMPYQEDSLVGKDAADFFLTNLKDPITNIEKIRFIANDSDAQMLAALQVEPGDRVTIDETITGISTDFFVNGVRYRLKPTNILEVTLHVEPAQDVLFWAIGEAGFSEIGETTPVVY